MQGKIWLLPCNGLVLLPCSKGKALFGVKHGVAVHAPCIPSSRRWRKSVTYGAKALRLCKIWAIQAKLGTVKRKGRICRAEQSPLRPEGEWERSEHWKLRPRCHASSFWTLKASEALRVPWKCTLLTFEALHNLSLWVWKVMTDCLFA